MYMLSAMTYENSKQDVAIGNYRYVIEHAKAMQHLMLLVPAFLRITQLLVRAERWAEALKLIELFEARFPNSESGPHFPSPKQRELMRITKTHGVQEPADEVVSLKTRPRRTAVSCRSDQDPLADTPSI